MSMNTYSGLSRAQLSYEYLHTNSTTHEFLFGALAELVDNARDANATKLSIFTLYDASLRGGFILCFLDDGEGMDPNETADIITFGRSSKRALDEHMIGMYGNGLKSGSMRIGNDLMVFTKKNGTMSCLFISRTFHEQENIDEVIVPLPSFEAGTQTPLDNSKQGQERLQMELDIILKYSPFKTEEDFFAQFDRIEGDSGTLVMVYNMKLLESGDPELDILNDPQDILLANPESDFDPDDGLNYEKRSFRAYVAILYIDPRMKVYIQGKKVRTRKLASCLFKPKYYKYASNRFKSRSEADARKALEDAKAAELRAKEAQSKAKSLEGRSGSLSKTAMAELRKANEHAAQMKRDAQLKKEHAERKQKALKDPKMLNLIFGINIDNRSHDGVFVYNCSRLIKMYEKVGPQTDGGVFCSGVIGIVNVPYEVLEPTHNKQDFADAKEYRHLMKVMGEHMVQYWKDLNIAQQGVLKFWESYGYISQKWKDPPSDDSKFNRKRAMQINITLQCDNCLKWRTLPFSTGNIGKTFGDDWVCAENPDTQHNKCAAAEQKLNIPEGVLKKEVKTQEQKTRDLEEEIRRKQEQLEKMHKNRIVTSCRELQEMDRKKEAEERRRKEEEEQRRQEEEEERERIEEERRKRKEMEEKRKKKEAEEREKQRQREQEEKRKKKEKEEKQKQKEKEAAEREKQRKKEQEAREREKERAREEKERAREEKERQKEKEQREREKQREKEQKEKEKQRLKDQKEKEKQKKLQEEERQRKREEAEERKRAAAEERKSKSAAAASSREALKRRPPTSTEEDEESEEEAVPAKKAKGSKATTTVISTTESSEAEESSPRRRSGRVTRTSEMNGALPSDGKGDAKESEDETAVSMDDGLDDDVSDGDVNDSMSEVDSQGEIGTKVEGYINKKWYSGTIVQVNNKTGKWKVKFDYNKRDKYDKWYDKTSANVRLQKSDASEIESSNEVPTSQSHDASAEAQPSSTTTTGNESQVIEEIANGYRTCLRYFLPPAWVMDKDSISGMSPQELATFPLDDFFDHYEKGLRKLVNNFQTEASLRKQEAEAAASKLSSVRKMIAKLLTSSNEEFSIDPECDTEQVDEFLHACLQASSAKSTDDKA